MFDNKKIIRSHRLDALKKSGDVEIIAFLGGLKRDRHKRLMANDKKDIAILRTWENHFVLYNIPYAVERKGDELYLWKECRI